MKGMVKNRKIIVSIISIIIVITMVISTVITAFADETKILTLGADLTDEQRQLIIDYLGVDLNSVQVITVNNEDEHQYLGGIIPDQKIGTRTYSCCYIEPTNEGGIHIKTVNLNYVDSDMIRNALITSGINNANVICVSPKPVSGTGAMVGVFKAYESIEGEELDSEKVEIASEELVTTAQLSEEVGKEEAANMMNELKELVIEKGKDIDREEVLDAIDKYVTEHQLNLTEDEKWKIVDILLKITQQDYDINEIRKSYKDMKETIADIKEKADATKNFIEKAADFIKTIWQKITGTYEEVKKTEEFQAIQEQLGIIAETNDELLGDSTVVTNTEDSTILNEISSGGIVSKEEKKGFIESIKEFFKSLAGKSDDTELNIDTEQTDTNATESINFDNFNEPEENIKESTEDNEDNEEEIPYELQELDPSNIEDSAILENSKEEEQTNGNLDYVTYELQELDPSKQEEQEENSKSSENSNTGTKSFDEITN